MGQPAEKLDRMTYAVDLGRRATYADLEAVPPGTVAEFVDGQLYVFPRPAPRHLNAETGMVAALRDPFQHGRGGPGGWSILAEPEVHFPEAAEPGGKQVVDPDVAGWTIEHMPDLPETAYFGIPPDWICEVLSSSTEGFDRKTKMPLYAHNGVPWAWLVDPIAKTLEVYTLGADRLWRDPTIHRGVVRVRIPPFEDIEFNLADLWARS